MFGKDGSEKQCAAIESSLIVYLDGRAAPAERHAVEEHLSGCVSCRARAEEFRALSSVLDDLPAISPSPSFDAALRARIAAEPAPRSFWSWLPSPRLAFAVTALVAMSVWMSSGPRVTNKPPMINHVIQSMETSKVTADSDFGMIRDLPVLENYDVVSKFDALSELPGPASASAQAGAKETR
jgi:hypothetical protein